MTCVLTEGGQQFVTPMALAALSENKVYTSLFDLKDEVEMGHIQLSREADLVVVCPATADLLAKMAAGIADDLATTLMLATDKPVLAVPAMNVRMWEHATTRRNVALAARRRRRGDGARRGRDGLRRISAPAACPSRSRSSGADRRDAGGAANATLPSCPGLDLEPRPIAGASGVRHGTGVGALRRVDPAPHGRSRRASCRMSCRRR